MPTPTTNWLIQKMDEWASATWAEPGDNIGLLIGDKSRPVSRVLTALDLSEAVLREAVLGKFDFIITHHALIYSPLNRITTDTAQGKKIMTCITNGISVFCAHTNLDAAPGGTNDLLFERLRLADKAPLIERKSANGEAIPPMGLIGFLSEAMPLVAFSSHVGQRLDCNKIRFMGDANKLIQKVALCGGGSMSERFVQAALAANCDVYVTGDIRHHLAMDAVEAGLALVDGTHFATEAPVAEAIASYVRVSAQQEGMELTVACSTAPSAGV